MTALRSGAARWAAVWRAALAAWQRRSPGQWLILWFGSSNLVMARCTLKRIISFATHAPSIAARCPVPSIGVSPRMPEVRGQRERTSQLHGTELLA